MAKVKAASGKAKAAPAPELVEEAPAKTKKRKGGICLFSGEPTSGGNFRPGYDAKMKSLLIRVARGDAKKSEIPAAALPHLKSEKGLVGFRMEGGELKVIGNFSLASKKAKKENTKVAAKSAASKQKAKLAVEEEEDEEDEVFEEEDEE